MAGSEFDSQRVWTFAAELDIVRTLNADFVRRKPELVMD